MSGPGTRVQIDTMCLFAFARIRWPWAAILLSICVVEVSAQTSPASLLSPADSKSPPKPESTSSAGPSAPQAIALPQIANRAEELHNQLLEIERQLNFTQQALPSEDVRRARTDEIRERAAFVDELVARVPTSMELRDQDQYWSVLSNELVSERKLLTSGAITLEEQVQFLESQRAIWQTTWNQIHLTPGIRPVIDRVHQELDAIEGERSRVQDELNRVLSLQNEVSQDERAISDVLAKLKKAREQMSGRLFERDGHPLWNARELRKLDRPTVFSIRPTFNRDWNDSKIFLRANGLRLLGVFVVYALTLLAVFRIRADVASRRALNVPPEALQILSRPYSVALVLMLVLTVGRLQTATSGIAFFFAFLWLTATLRLLPGLIKPGPRSLLYAFIPILIVEGARVLVPFTLVARRDLFVLNIVLSMTLFAWLIRPVRLSRQHMDDRRSRLLVFAIRLGITLLAAALTTNAFGYLSLSQVLGIVVLLGFFGGAALFCAVRILTLLLSILFQTDWVRATFQSRTIALERWASRVVAYGAAFVWLNGLLRILTIRDKIGRLISDGLQYRLGYGPLGFTAGGLFRLLAIVLVGCGMAKLVTFTLKRLVLPKLPLQRGISYAVSTITYYVLLLLVALIGLAETGVELNKFTMLTGAIGVGLGFGLQNVVNNFVSGLILLFERPIHVGDTVDVGGLVGTVRRIGARSSTVVTFQGAEVIVPNSNLLSNQVINWTLSSQWRRVDIPVSVAHGTDPELVLKVLTDVAESHPLVLRERPPAAFFLGFGENGLNFELRFWSATQDTWFQLQSDIAVSVAKALRNAAIQIPFPQRDLHIRSMDASIREALLGIGLEDSLFAYSVAREQSRSTERGPTVRDAKQDK